MTAVYEYKMIFKPQIVFVHMSIIDFMQLIVRFFLKCLYLRRNITALQILKVLLMLQCLIYMSREK